MPKTDYMDSIWNDIVEAPEEYHSLIEDALSEYGSSVVPQYDKELSVKYAEYMLKLIRGAIQMP